MRRISSTFRLIHFWLTNRRPNRWKKKRSIEHDEAIGSPIRILAEQISGNAIRPRLPEPKTIEPAAAEPNAIRPQHPTAHMPSVITSNDIKSEDVSVTPAQVVTHAVDDDDDMPRAPRIHTISKTYLDDEDV